MPYSYINQDPVSTTTDLSVARYSQALLFSSQRPVFNRYFFNLLSVFRSSLTIRFVSASTLIYYHFWRNPSTPFFHFL